MAKKKKGAMTQYGYRLQGLTPTEQKRHEAGVPHHVKIRHNDVMIGLLMLKAAQVTEHPDIDLTAIAHIKQRQGMCFELSGRLIMDNPDWIIVHATLYPRVGWFENQIYFHAYLAKDGVVYDPVFDAFYDREKMEKYYDATDIREYTQEQALAKMLKTKHYGSWD